MKTIALAVVAVATISSSADAGKRVGLRAKAPAVAAQPASAIIPVKDAEVKFNFGADYALGAKTMATPDVEEETFVAMSITQTQALKVVADKTAELEYCWLRVPAAKRTASSAALTLMIEPSGAVAGAFIEGTLPAGVATCIEKVAARWTFPAADAGAEIEHPLSFNGKTDTLK